MTKCLAAGTHDNETAVGWWKDSATPAEKAYINKYLNVSGRDIAGDFMRESFKSVSRTSIVMLQVIGQAPAQISYLSVMCISLAMSGVTGTLMPK